MSVTGKKNWKFTLWKLYGPFIITLLEWILIFHMDTTGFSVYFQHALSMYINNKWPEILGKILIWHTQLCELFREDQVKD